MIFNNLNQSSALLADKIKEENLADFTLTYISPEALNFCQLVAQNLLSPLNYLPEIIETLTNTDCLIILDDGSTRASEYLGFSDKIKKQYPHIKLIIATPIVPETEVKTLQSSSDSLLYLTAEPLFFSPKQFYSDTPLT